MKNHSLDEIYRGIHPALGSIGTLHWNSIVDKTPATPLVLYGDTVSCELFRQRFENNNIPVAGIILHGGKTAESVITPEGPEVIQTLPDDAIVIVTLRDYPRDIELYYAVKSQLKEYGVIKPYVIHEFCSGFALNADKLISERDRVIQAFSLLLASSSRECFQEYIKNAATPYHWNMDITNELFGIEDTHRPTEKVWTHGEYDPVLSDDGCVVYCNTREFHCGDPRLKLLRTSRNSFMFYPNPISRLKLREYLSAQECTDGVLVLDRMLWNREGLETVVFKGYSGGTPLSYAGKKHVIHTMTVDGLMELLKELRLDLLVLDLDEDFVNVLEGAETVLHSDHPTIIINGFSKVDQLWNSIIKLNEMLPHYRMSLHRYPSANILEGHSIILEYGKEK